MIIAQKIHNAKRPNPNPAANAKRADPTLAPFPACPPSGPADFLYGKVEPRPGCLMDNVLQRESGVAHDRGGRFLAAPSFRFGRFLL
jgi:hypothetical protein